MPPIVIQNQSPNAFSRRSQPRGRSDSLRLEERAEVSRRQAARVGAERGEDDHKVSKFFAFYFLITNVLEHLPH